MAVKDGVVMTRGQTLALDALVPNCGHATFFLEIGSIETFLSWLTRDAHRAELVKEGMWSVNVFRHQLRPYADYLKRRRSLRDLGIGVIDCDLKPQDGIFVDEFERTYFESGGPGARQRSEFYVLVRRTIGGGWVNVISQNTSYDRIPFVNTYFDNYESRTGSPDVPAQFDFLRDLDIHRELVRAVGGQLNQGQYGDIMFAAIIALLDHVRTASKLAQHDGRDLMLKAFKQDGSHLCLNQLSLPNRQSEQHEQQGFRELFCGV